MEILKRILLAIVVLPVSFVVVFFFAAVLFAFGVGLFDFTHLDASELFRDPTNFAQKAQTAWLDMSAQYTSNSSALYQRAWAAWQASAKQHASTIEAFAAIYASIGAIVFFMSCLGYTLYVTLLTSRRIITIPLLFSYAFIISLSLIYVVVDFICVSVVQMSSAPGAQTKNVTDFHASYGMDLILGTLLVALIFSSYLTHRLVRWDGLPWCRNPLPVQPRSRVNPKR